VTSFTSRSVSLSRTKPLAGTIVCRFLLRNESRRRPPHNNGLREVISSILYYSRATLFRAVLADVALQRRCVKGDSPRYHALLPDKSRRMRDPSRAKLDLGISSESTRDTPEACLSSTFATSTVTVSRSSRLISARYRAVSILIRLGLTEIPRLRRCESVTSLTWLSRGRTQPPTRAMLVRDALRFQKANYTIQSSPARFRHDSRSRPISSLARRSTQTDAHRQESGTLTKVRALRSERNGECPSLLSSMINHREY